MLVMNWAERDRAHGQGLPYKLNIERLADRLGMTSQRVASRTELMAAGFEPEPDRPGFYRRGHALWALEEAQDGYVLVRKHEERAVDRRTACRDETPAPEFHVGQRVAFAHRGQMVDAVIIMLNDDDADLETCGCCGGVHDPMDAAPEPEHVMGVPTEQLVLLEVGSPDPFAPAIEPSSRLAAPAQQVPKWIDPEHLSTPEGEELPEDHPMMQSQPVLWDAPDTRGPENFSPFLPRKLDEAQLRKRQEETQSIRPSIPPELRNVRQVSPGAPPELRNVRQVVDPGGHGGVWPVSPGDMDDYFRNDETLKTQKG